MRRRTVAPDRHNPAVIEFPNDLEIVVRRDFDGLRANFDHEEDLLRSLLGR